VLQDALFAGNDSTKDTQSLKALQVGENGFIKIPGPTMRMKNERLFAALELCLLSLLFWATVWGPAISGVKFWNIAAGFLFFMTVVVSAILRKPGLKESGFRVDNLASAVVQIGLVTAFVVIVINFVANLMSYSFFWPSISRSSYYLWFGVFQQCLILGYFFHRWAALLPSLIAAAAANSLWFGLAHFPDAALVTIAGFGEFCFNWLFIRVHNVIVIGFAHGILPLLLNAGAMKTPRIGPAALEPFARTINRDPASADRLGICSRVLARDQLGQGLDLGVERVFLGKSDDQSIRKSLIQFLSGSGKAFCLITEREFHRYIEPTVQKRLFIVDDRYIWRNPKNFPHLYDRDPILGLFRDRVMLVSNQPSA
jgi:hypothetical protein